MFDQISTLGRSIFVESSMFLKNFRLHKPVSVTICALLGMHQILRTGEF